MKFEKILFLCISLGIVSSKAVTSDGIEGKYVVWLKEPNSFVELQDYVDSHINRVFENELTSPVLRKFRLGYGARLTDKKLQEIELLPEVEFVEKNQLFHVNEIQKDPLNWGLKRISKRVWTDMDHYVYPSSSGENVYVYIVDTGVMIKHAEFEGRAIWGYSSIEYEQDEYDYHGHGTHVASTVAGVQHGVAKKSIIIAVKVLDKNGYGQTIDVIDGIEFVMKSHIQMSGKSEKPVRAVANMSLGGGKSRALERAVEAAIRSGVQFAVAAGNENQNACGSSPAATVYAVTVGASTKMDVRSFFSNWGECVDIFAPGSDITAAWNDGQYKTISGTSMASPHVCGVMALIHAENEDFLSPQELKELVIEVSTKDKLALVRTNSPNRLLYSPYSEASSIVFQ